MEFPTKSENSDNALNYSGRLFFTHSRPSFEQELSSKEFSTQICRGGKLQPLSTLHHCDSHLSINKGMFRILSPGHTLSDKKLHLVNALNSSNQIGKVGSKEMETNQNTENFNLTYTKRDEKILFNYNGFDNLNSEQNIMNENNFIDNNKTQFNNSKDNIETTKFINNNNCNDCNCLLF